MLQRNIKGFYMKMCTEEKINTLGSKNSLRYLLHVYYVVDRLYKIYRLWVWVRFEPS